MIVPVISKKLDYKPSMVLRLALGLVAATAHAAQSVPDDAQPKHQPGVRVVAPGVKIDWRHRVVEVDARVVLRSGPLELLACSPGTREHESILVVQARPLSILQAMGLIGLEPGSPVRYDQEREQIFPPTGERLDLSIRYQQTGKSHVVRVEQWLRDVERRKSPEQMPWVFSGSRTGDRGRLLADADGTVVCVVDFESALIAVGDLHTDDNELLWLEANTSAIPPLGTDCTLLIRSAEHRVVPVTLLSNGRFRLDGKVVTLAHIAKELLPTQSETQSAALDLYPQNGLSAGRLERALVALERAGIKRNSVQIRRQTTPGDRKAVPTPPAGG